ncbi:MAG TPA: CNP1-like family protein [Burkholderiaceae bacterium]
MKLIVRTGAALLASGVLAACSGMPKISFGTPSSEEPSAAWQEQSATLPAAPNDAQLVPFYVSPTATMRHALDAGTLAIGADGVIRYTLLALGPTGARNVSYEGLRCATGEFKQYAYGRNDGTWARPREERWQPLAQFDANNPQALLARDFFCQGRAASGSALDLLRKLRAAPQLSN